MLPKDKPVLSAERLEKYREFEREVRKDMEQLDIGHSSVGGVQLLRIRSAITYLQWIIKDRPEDFHKFDTAEHQRKYPPRKPPFPPRHIRKLKSWSE